MYSCLSAKFKEIWKLSWIFYKFYTGNHFLSYPICFLVTNSLLEWGVDSKRKGEQTLLLELTTTDMGCKNSLEWATSLLVYRFTADQTLYPQQDLNQSRYLNILKHAGILSLLHTSPSIHSNSSFWILEQFELSSLFHALTHLIIY